MVESRAAGIKAKLVGMVVDMVESQVEVARRVSMTTGRKVASLVVGPTQQHKGQFGGWQSQKGKYGSWPNKGEGKHGKIFAPQRSLDLGFKGYCG